MFKLSKKVDYGLILLGRFYAGRQGEHSSSARELAERFNLPQPMVANVLKDLAAGGILTSTRGVQGGYALARDAARISLWDVVQVLDGPFGLMECTGEAPSCERQDGCSMHNPIQRVHERFQQFMAGFTLEEIMEGSGPLGLRLGAFKPAGSNQPLLDPARP